MAEARLGNDLAVKGGVVGMELIGRLQNEYFDIFCAGCGEQTTNLYLGEIAGVPQFKATCPQCGRTWTLKLDRALWSCLPEAAQR